MTFSGWAGVLAGWYTTEIGRQPYLVHGLLKTSDAVTTVPASSIGVSLALYLALYLVLIVSCISVMFYLARQAGKAETKASEPTALGPSVLGSPRTETEHA
jgi:cytochrome d ubiquinol oxidase subunit I